MMMADHAFSRNDHGRWKSNKRPEGRFDIVSAVSDQYGVIHLKLGSKSSDRGKAVIYRNSDDRQPFGLEGIEEFHEARYFNSTRSAPGRPEVEQNHLTRMFTEIVVVTILVNEGEIEIG